MSCLRLSILTVWKTMSQPSRNYLQLEKQCFPCPEILNGYKNNVSASFALKFWFLTMSRSRLSILTFSKLRSRPSRNSQQFKNWHLDVSGNLDLDLDWSRKLWPTTLNHNFVLCDVIEVILISGPTIRVWFIVITSSLLSTYWGSEIFDFGIGFGLGQNFGFGFWWNFGLGQNFRYCFGLNFGFGMLCLLVLVSVHS